MKTHSRTPQSHSQKTDSTLLTKFLVILGIFGVTTFVTYGAVSTPESAFMSTPYMTRSSTGDLVLSNATNGQGAAILNAYIAKILSGATAQGGVPAYNAYLNDKLNQLDLLDTELQGKRDNNGKLIYDKDYTFIFSYIYPRLHEQLKLDQTTSVIGEIRSRLGLNGPVDDSNLRPIPAAPAVTANDTTNTVNGWNAATMEASLSSDGGNSYGAFTSAAQDLNGNKMLYVRLKATNTALSSLITVLTFTENTQQSTGFTFSASFNPATISATGSSVLSYSSNAAGGCSYNLAGGNGGTANGNVTINASAFNIPAGTTTNTGRTVTFACYNANSTLAGTGSASITILAPPAVVAATPAPTVSITSSNMNGQAVTNDATITATAAGNVQLTWSSTNATSCFLDNPPNGKFNALVSTGGTNTFTGFTTTDKNYYTFKCLGSGAASPAELKFYVQGVAPVAVAPAVPSVTIKSNEVDLANDSSVINTANITISATSSNATRYEMEITQQGTPSISQFDGSVTTKNVLTWGFAGGLNKIRIKACTGSLCSAYSTEFKFNLVPITNNISFTPTSVLNGTNNRAGAVITQNSNGLSYDVGLQNGDTQVNVSYTAGNTYTSCRMFYINSDGSMGGSKLIFEKQASAYPATGVDFGEINNYSGFRLYCYQPDVNGVRVNAVTREIKFIRPPVVPTAPVITANSLANATVGIFNNMTLTVAMDASKIDYYKIKIGNSILKDATGNDAHYTATTSTASPVAFGAGFRIGTFTITTIGCKAGVCGTESPTLTLNIVEPTQPEMDKYIVDVKNKHGFGTPNYNEPNAINELVGGIRYAESLGCTTVRQLVARSLNVDISVINSFVN